MSDYTRLELLALLPYGINFGKHDSLPLLGIGIYTILMMRFGNIAISAKVG